MVEYLAGGRIQGISALSSPPPATSWKEIGRTTLGSTNSNITVSSFTAKDNIMVLHSDLGRNADSSSNEIRFNSDTGSNYSSRSSSAGASDNTYTSDTGIVFQRTAGDTNQFSVTYVNNTANKEKLSISHSVQQRPTGAGNVPHRSEAVGKWANTSDSITSWTSYTGSSDTWNAGSEVVVLGCDHDEADSGTSVWEELASVDLSGGTGNSLSSGTISAKKYLWVQAYLEQSGSGDTGNICRFNSDSGSNYTVRYSENGGSDTTSTSRSNIVTGANSGTDGAGEGFFINMFIINKSDKEKLIIGKLVDTDAGGGAGTAPGRSEFVGKWDNTSDSITNITWTNSGGSATWATTSYLKVWGFD